MAQDHIRYDILAQDALRSVIRKVLTEVAATGHLPGDHHFFITFLTGAPGVRISQHLKAKYAEQMTIVVQHQFWDLKITESQFEIGLSFSDTPEKLVIPFNAIRGFYDPSVNFELEFDVPAIDEDDITTAEITAYPVQTAETIEELVGENQDGEGKKPKKKDDNTDGDKPGGSVVSLDSFRKKH
ncbi:SspB family protein [Pararhizobium sp.]|uniref:SspB family protein n=1 Tax=Pararhizobium sp. TaxID=1977563 RepID=UPI0027273DEB|nr:SspB family protein [Pararhizobium sp.]MDO9418793.1 SspB family protein [Pararhizobium sp.]